MGNEALVMAQSAFSSLSDIQPNLSLRGMQGEYEQVVKVKEDLAAIIGALTPTQPAVERVVASCRRDTVSTFFALRNQICALEDEEQVSDEYLHMACLAAEMFLRRCQDYLSSKKTLDDQFGG